MPGETHQITDDIGREDIEVLLQALVGPLEHDRLDEVTLGDLGVDGDDVLDLWKAVCEEFGERTLGSEIDPHALGPTMTLEEAATTMAGLLGGGSDDDG